MFEYLIFCYKLWREIQKADAKHGDWEDKSNVFMYCKMTDETLEVGKAIGNNDIYGSHGILKECVHVAVTAYKMYRRMK